MRGAGKPSLFTEGEEKIIDQLEAILTFVTSSDPPTIASVKLAEAVADRLTEVLANEIIHGRGGSLFSTHLRHGVEVALSTVRHHGIVLTMPDELRQVQVGQAST